LTEFGIYYNVGSSTMPFDETLRTQSAPDLHCDNIAVTCWPNFSCPGPGRCDYSCASGRNCPGGCSWWDAGCIAWKALCETLKAGETAGCEVGRGVCIAGCSAELAAKNIACNAEFLAKQAGCRLNQAWLNAWANIDIGNVKGSASIERTTVALEIKGSGVGAPAIEVTPNFDQFTIRGAVSATGDLKADFQYTPLNIGHILCIAQWSGSISAHAKATQLAYSVTGSILPQQIGDSLQLWVVSNPVDFALQLSPAPVAALFEQNPQAAIICAPATAIGITVQLFGDLKALITKKANDLNLLQDTFPYQIQSLRSPIVIQPIGFYFPTAPGSNPSPFLSLVPAWLDSSVSFTKKQ
jgi:hypothetical protein